MTKHLLGGDHLADNKQQSTESPDKVFDTRGIEASLTRTDRTIQARDNSRQNAAAAEANNADLDNQAKGIVTLNGIPVSASTGTARTALMQPQEQSDTI